MGTDWEDILGAEGEDIQDAYEDAVDRAMRQQDEDDALHRDLNSDPITPPSKPKPPKRYALRPDQHSLMSAGDIMIGENDPIPEGYHELVIPYWAQEDNDEPRRTKES